MGSPLCCNHCRSAFRLSRLRSLISSLYQGIAGFFFTVLVFSRAWSSMIFRSVVLYCAAIVSMSHVSSLQVDSVIVKRHDCSVSFLNFSMSICLYFRYVMVSMTVAGFLVFNWQTTKCDQICSSLQLARPVWYYRSSGWWNDRAYVHLCELAHSHVVVVQIQAIDLWILRHTCPSSHRHAN